MGVEVSLTEPQIDVLVATARRTGLNNAAKAVLGVSDGLAPTEPEPRHGVHMTETGFTRVEPGGDGEDTVALGYRAFWAVFQEENLTYHHEHGGQAKFLSTAVSTSGPLVEEIVAAELRGLFS